MFFKHFVNKNQLPGLFISGILVENGLKRLDEKEVFIIFLNAVESCMKKMYSQSFSRKNYFILEMGKNGLNK